VPLWRGRARLDLAELQAANVTRAQIGKGHHFSGEYAALAQRILAFARASGK
jgi:type IV secretory pathway VirJ component